jgi:hypothetical protein
MAVHCRTNIRAFNSVFSFTSTGVTLTEMTGRGPYCYNIQGELVHRYVILIPCICASQFICCHFLPFSRIGSLLRDTSKRPTWGQMYVYDTQNELDNRISVFQHLVADPNPVKREQKRALLRELQQMMHRLNPYAIIYRMAGDQLRMHPTVPLKIVLHADIAGTDQRRYNKPAADDVAALMIGTDAEQYRERDIVLTAVAGSTFLQFTACTPFIPMH